MLSGSVTSVRKAIASPPACTISCAVCSPASPFSSATTTFAPSAANSLAEARPIPVPAPVTTATFPSRRGIDVSSAYVGIIVTRQPPGINRGVQGDLAMTASPAASFGSLPDGQTTSLYTLHNDHLRVGITDYGGRMVSIQAPDRNGHHDH